MKKKKNKQKTLHYVLLDLNPLITKTLFVLILFSSPLLYPLTPPPPLIVTNVWCLGPSLFLEKNYWFVFFVLIISVSDLKMDCWLNYIYHSLNMKNRLLITRGACFNPFLSQHGLSCSYTISPLESTSEQHKGCQLHFFQQPFLCILARAESKYFISVFIKQDDWCPNSLHGAHFRAETGKG